jgi:G3E family GTPase
VGSCTDLVATILLPLQHYYPELFEVAPLTILLDGDRNTAEFPAIVNYLYQKQLAEADLIGLNKCDLLTPAQQKQKLAELEASYPHSRVLKLSARSGEGLDDWLALALAETSQARQPLSLDYAKYAEAEAGLGWLNAKGALIARPSFEAQSWATRLLTNMEENFAAQAAPIGHIKISLKTPAGTLKASLTQLGRPIDWDAAPARVETDRAQFILNARVNTDPQTLAQTVRRSFEATRPQPDFRCDFTHFECFSPSPPQPTYRESGD